MSKAEEITSKADRRDGRRRFKIGVAVLVVPDSMPAMAERVAGMKALLPPDPADVDEERLRGSLDAQVWAEEFVKVCPHISEGLMIGWFANAIEQARAWERRTIRTSAPVCSAGHPIEPRPQTPESVVTDG